MTPIKISLVLLGNLKYPINIAQLQSWDSQILQIHQRTAVGHLPDAVGDNWEYTDAQLLEVIGAEQDVDITLGLISLPLESNYYMRRLSDRVAVVSLHEMAEIMRYSGFSLENYILRNAYELVVLFIGNGKLIPAGYTTWVHDEVRGCIFDMNSNKFDIIFSMDQPTLCQACRTRLLSKQTPADLIPRLDRELRRIRKPLYLRIIEWVKIHPIIALLLTATFSVALNLAASIIYEKAKHLWPWLG